MALSDERLGELAVMLARALDAPRFTGGGVRLTVVPKTRAEAEQTSRAKSSRTDKSRARK